MALSIHPASAEADFAAVRDLCRAFRADIAVEYAVENDVVETYYAEAAFEALLADLPALHAPPGGQIYLAKLDGAPVGCGMFSALDGGACELKRMFVSNAARGHGVGRALALTAMADARAAGYGLMKLDTGPRQRAALALYRDLGFIPTEPAPSMPERLRKFLVYLERPLTDDDLQTQ